MRKGRVAKEARRTAAEARQAERGKRTNEQQLKKLIFSGHGHCKEAQRLAGGIDAGSIVEVAVEWEKSASFRGDV
ncbi:hypothetical protein LCGC14_0207910 [marine sediment metagenome]|uniref:Uncharacterized protein n=1 Tax=marine sediment metagenome TaxID=412755 RepID=A0A0F9UGH4_9ZZZZ